MENKDRYLLLELCLTFFALFLIISLFGEALSAYRIYLIFGLAFGFCFSWFIRDRYNRVISFFITAGVFAVLAWLTYLVLNSSLFYKDVILICIKGLFILEFIFSFNACLTPFLTYIQALSIPLFMSYPALIKDNYNESSLVLTMAYIISLFAIFKVKFYRSFNPPDKMKSRRYNSIFLSGIFFLGILISSWLFFSKFPLGEVRKGGVLPEEGPGEDGRIEKEYYDLQDKIQEEMAKLIPRLNSPEDRHEALYLFSLLIKESPYTIEVDNAEQGLISQLKQPGAGLEKKDAEGFTALLKSYVDKKIVLNLKRNKDGIMDILKKNPLDLINRVSILSRVNKLQYSDSYEKLSRYEQELRKNIKDSSLPADVKADMKELAIKIKEWKAFEVYRKKLSSLDKGIDSLGGDLGKELAGFASKVKELDKPSDYKEMASKLKDFKEGAAGQLQDLIKELEEVSDLKLEMSLLQKNINLKEGLESSGLPENQIAELKENVDIITGAQDYQVISGHSDELKEKSEEGHTDISGELRELLETKTYSLIKEKKNKVEDMLKESALPDAQKKEFLSELERLESVKNPARLTSDIKKLEASIDKLLNQGFISKEAREGLIKEIKQLEGLFLSQLETQENALTRQRGGADSQKKWEELVEELPLKEETRGTLRKLTEELSGADTVSKIENIRQAVEKTIESLYKDQIAELKDLLSSQAELKEKELTRQRGQADSQKKWEELVEELPLKEEARQELKQLAEELSQVDTLSKLENIKQQAEKQLDTLSNQGVKNDQIAELKDLLSSQAELKEKELTRQRGQADSQKKWEELVEELPLKEEARQELKQLAEELSQVDTLSKLENIKQQAEKELAALSKAALSKERVKEEAERVKEAFKQLFELKRMNVIDRSLSSLNKNIEKLKEIDPQVNRMVEEHLRRLRNSSTAQEFQKRLDILKEYISSKVSENKEAHQEYRELNPWQIYIMPARLIIPFDSSASLRAVAIYNKVFIKELGSELEWFSSDPNVARVDEAGVVHSLSKGTTKISIRYKGKTFEGAEVVVVDKIAGGIGNEIKGYLIR